MSAAVPGAVQVAASLLEQALHHIRDGAEALEDGRPADAPAALREAAQIIIELHTALDPDGAPVLATALGGIYRHVCLRLNDAALLRDAGRAREAERMFEPIADAFGAAAARLSPREDA